MQLIVREIKAHVFLTANSTFNVEQRDLRGC